MPWKTRTSSAGRSPCLLPTISILEKEGCGETCQAPFTEPLLPTQPESHATLRISSVVATEAILHVHEAGIGTAHSELHEYGRHAAYPMPRPGVTYECSKVHSMQWPSLEWREWQATAETLHMFTQIVGKTRLALTPRQNHWWNVTLYVTARGLSTSAMPLADGDALEIEFDFLSHLLTFRRSSGAARALGFEPQSVCEFYAAYLHTLKNLGVRGRHKSSAGGGCESHSL